MTGDADQERVASVPVAAGVFVLRYQQSADVSPPRVFVEVSPTSRPDVRIIFLPGQPEGVLERPKQIALVLAGKRGRLQLTVSPVAGGGTSARVELEPIAQEAQESVAEAQPIQAPASERVRKPSIPLLSCHVAKRGDIVAGLGDWVGGPDAPAVIEGVKIDWDDADPAALEYQALSQGAQGQWSEWRRAGEFVGTRGRGLALVGLRLRLTRAAPADLTLTAEGAFLGSPLVRERGREVELSSYAGIDPLVGLRLETQISVASEEIVIRDGRVAEPMQAGSALKIFRSKRSADRALGLAE